MRRIAEHEDRVADLQLIAVAESPPTSDRLSVNERPIPRKPVVRYDPSSAEEREFGVKTGDACVPGEADEAFGSASEEQSVLAAQRDDPLLAVSLAKDEKRVPFAFRVDSGLQLGGTRLVKT